MVWCSLCVCVGGGGGRGVAPLFQLYNYTIVATFDTIKLSRGTSKSLRLNRLVSVVTGCITTVNRFKLGFHIL